MFHDDIPDTPANTPDNTPDRDDDNEVIQLLKQRSDRIYEITKKVEPQVLSAKAEGDESAAAIMTGFMLGLMLGSNLMMTGAGEHEAEALLVDLLAFGAPNNFDITQG